MICVVIQYDKIGHVVVLGMIDAEDKCVCPDIYVKPNGNIHQCGCPGSPKIGHVSTGYTSVLDGECYRFVEYIQTVNSNCSG